MAADRAACGDIAARVPQSGSRLNRVIDLSLGAARVVGLHRSGIAQVRFFVMQ